MEHSHPKAGYSHSIYLVAVTPNGHFRSLIILETLPGSRSLAKLKVTYDSPAQRTPGEIEGRNLNNDEANDDFAKCGRDSPSRNSQASNDEDRDRHETCRDEK